MTRQAARGLLTEREAIAGRAAGLSQRAIAARLGLNPSAVSRALKRARVRLENEIPCELADVLRHEHAVLELARRAAWAKWAEGGDLPALDRVLRASEQIAQLWGLGHRARVDVSVRRPDLIEAMDDAALLEAAEREIAEARDAWARRALAVAPEPSRSTPPHTAAPTSSEAPGRGPLPLGYRLPSD